MLSKYLLPLALSALSVEASKYFFVFGDSYTSDGFNVTGAQPADSPGNQIGNPAVGSATTVSPDYNWIETLGVKYSPGNTLIFDYARPGAYISQDAVNGSTGREYELQWQVNKFLTTVGTTPRKSSAPWTADNSIAFFWFGTNDFLSITPEGVDNGKAPEATKTVITSRINNDLSSYLLNIATLYAAGLRQFVVIGSPPVYTSGGFGLSGRSTAAKAGIEYFNNAAQYYIAYFQNLYPDAKIAFRDPKDAWDNVAAQGKDVWKDLIHPTAPVHSAVAYAVRGVIQSSPFNFYS